MSEERQQQAEGYEPPHAKDVPAEDGPAVTAAGVTGDGGPEWRPEEQTEA
jgi:hypothetical protein